MFSVYVCISVPEGEQLDSKLLASKDGFIQFAV